MNAITHGETLGGIRTDASLSLQVAGLVGDSIVDGPGLRFVVFCQGCPHGCAGCHNPETHPFSGGRMIAPDELLAEIRKNPLCRGVTFSGGEPFCQAGALLPLARALRDAGYELAAYTGYTFERLCREAPARRLLELLDVLIDGPYVAARRNLNLRFRGSENQRILNVPQSLAEGRAVLEQSPRWHANG